MFRSGQEDLVNFVLKQHHNLGSSESAFINCACPNTVPLLLAALRAIHEKNWKRLGVLERFHVPDFP